EAATAERLALVGKGKAAAVADALGPARAALGAPERGRDDLIRLRERVLAAWEKSARNALASWAKGSFTQAEARAFAERCPAISDAAERLAPLVAHLEKTDPEQLALLAPTLASLAADAEQRLARQGRVSFE